MKMITSIPNRYERKCQSTVATCCSGSTGGETKHKVSNRLDGACSCVLRPLVMLLCNYALMALPVSAAPFAYIRVIGGVSVIDTATNTLVASIVVNGGGDLAITPDGKRVYVTTGYHEVSVIDTATNTVVVPQITVWNGAGQLAITPDGKRVYVASAISPAVLSAIDTATNTVVPVTPIPVGYAEGIAITPDGKRVYIAAGDAVFVIDTATNTVMTSITVEIGSKKVAITPDGKQVYVTHFWFMHIEGGSPFGTYSRNMSVIDTLTNTKVASVIVGEGPKGLAISPDGKRVYVANYHSNDVSVFDTTSNNIVGGLGLRTSRFEPNPYDVDITPDGKRAYVSTYLGIYVFDTTTNMLVGTPILAEYAPTGSVVFTPLPTSTTFAAFNVNKLTLGQRHKDLFLLSSFTLGKDSNGIDLKGDAVTLKVGNLTLTIPAGSFRNNNHGLFTFVGEIDKLWVEAVIKPLGNNRYEFQATEYGADLGKIKNPVAVELTIGNDSGTASVKANVRKDDDGNRDDGKDDKGKDH